MYGRVSLASGGMAKGMREVMSLLSWACRVLAAVSMLCMVLAIAPIHGARGEGQYVPGGDIDLARQRRLRYTILHHGVSVCSVCSVRSVGPQWLLLG